LETSLQTSSFFVDECKQTGVTCSRAMLVKYPGTQRFLYQKERWWMCVLALRTTSGKSGCGDVRSPMNTTGADTVRLTVRLLGFQQCQEPLALLRATSCKAFPPASGCREVIRGHFYFASLNLYYIPQTSSRPHLVSLP
jgi:hypothetical protein